MRRSFAFLVVILCVLGVWLGQAIGVAASAAILEQSPNVVAYTDGSGRPSFQVGITSSLHPYTRTWNSNTGWGSWTFSLAQPVTPASNLIYFRNPSGGADYADFDIASSNGAAYCYSGGWQDPIPNDGGPTLATYEYTALSVASGTAFDGGSEATPIMALRSDGVLLYGLIDTTHNCVSGFAQPFTALSQPVGLAGGVVVQTGQGGVGGANDAFTAYVTGTDNNIWHATYTPIFNSWSSFTKITLTKPSIDSVGAVEAVPGNAPLVTWRGNDGLLWYDQTWNGGQGNLGTPSSANIRSGPGCAGVSIYQLCAIVASDHNIWERLWNGSSWSAWTSLGSGF